MVDFCPLATLTAMKSSYDFDATIRQQLDLLIFHLKLPCQPRGLRHLDVDVVAWSSLTYISSLLYRFIRDSEMAKRS
jgi:hypothetical protein